MPQYLEPGARVSERWSPGRCVRVELREPPAITEDPMTEDRMALVELLQKSGDGDFLRAVAEAVLQILMEADVEGLIGAGRHERTGDRLNYRNGYRDRSLPLELAPSPSAYSLAVYRPYKRRKPLAYISVMRFTRCGCGRPRRAVLRELRCGSDRNYTAYCDPDIDKLFDRQSMQPDQD